jgi:hypothetical protein
MSVIIKLLSKFDDSGLRKAKSSFGGLGKALGAVGIGFGIKQISDGLLDAAKAASADAKSTQLLNTQLVKNAGATKAALTQNDKFIEALSLETGIMDDDLRPAMGKLARATGDVDKAQELLALSLDAATVAGKPVDTVAQAISRAFTGNKTALVKLFPTLKTSTDLFGDLEKIVGGAAIAQADPFMKLNNSMDILKEKLGVVVLPILVDFIDEISKPGGAIEVVGKFFDDLANPKSDVGKTFTEIKTAVDNVIGSVKTFFGYFGGGDAVAGFKNIATSLISALPALLALKGIMLLASGGKAIASLVTAMGIIAGKGAVPTGIPPVAGAINPITGIAVGSQIATLAAASAAQDTLTAGLAAKGLKTNVVSSTFTGGMALPYDPNNPLILGGKRAVPQTNTNVTINVTNADPKATVVALTKYLKENGKTLTGTDLRRALG